MSALRWVGAMLVGAAVALLLRSVVVDDPYARGFDDGSYNGSASQAIMRSAFLRREGAVTEDGEELTWVLIDGALFGASTYDMPDFPDGHPGHRLEAIAAPNREAGLAMVLDLRRSEGRDSGDAQQESAIESLER